MALTQHDQKIMDDFRDLLTDRLVSDYERTTSPVDRARLAKARGKAEGLKADAEYRAAVFAAERAAFLLIGRAPPTIAQPDTRLS